MKSMIELMLAWFRSLIRGRWNYSIQIFITQMRNNTRCPVSIDAAFDMLRNDSNKNRKGNGHQNDIRKRVDDVQFYIQKLSKVNFTPDVRFFLSGRSAKSRVNTPKIALSERFHNHHEGWRDMIFSAHVSGTDSNLNRTFSTAANF